MVGVFDMSDDGVSGVCRGTARVQGVSATCQGER